MSKEQTNAFVAKFPVRFGRSTVQPGERLELTQDQAASLLAQKIVAPAPAEVAADEGSQAPAKTNAKTQGSKA